MEVKIKHNEELIDATIEMVDGMMVVTPNKELIKELDFFQYKDGDIIVCGWEKGYAYCEWVCVLRGQIEVIASNLYIEDYCCLDVKSNTGERKLTTTSGFSDSATYVRYATEEERQKLFDALAKEGKMWNSEKKVLVDAKWKPKLEEVFYAPYATSCYQWVVGSFEWCNTTYEEDNYNKGFIFPNTDEGKSKCQSLCNKLNEAIKDVKP